MGALTERESMKKAFEAYNRYLESRIGEDTLYLPYGSDIGSFDEQEMLQTMSDINKDYKKGIHCLYMGFSNGRYELKTLYEDLDTYVIFLDESGMGTYSEKYDELSEEADMESSEKGD